MYVVGGAHAPMHVWRSEDKDNLVVVQPLTPWASVLNLRSPVLVASAFTG